MDTLYNSISNSNKTTYLSSAGILTASGVINSDAIHCAVVTSAFENEVISKANVRLPVCELVFELDTSTEENKKGHTGSSAKRICKYTYEIRIYNKW